MKRFTMLFGLGITLFISGVALADVPKLINFQGILRDGSGNPVPDVSYSMTFRIYNAASAGTVLWAETLSVPTLGGQFSVNLGADNSIPDTVFNDTLRWLGTTVSPDPEMTPRQRLVSVGYAYRVASVDGATGGVISGDVSIQSQLNVAGTIKIQEPPEPDMPGLVIQGASGQTANFLEIFEFGGTSPVPRLPRMERSRCEK